jgi:hypothetical protein
LLDCVIPQRLLPMMSVRTPCPVAWWHRMTTARTVPLSKP